MTWWMSDASIFKSQTITELQYTIAKADFGHPTRADVLQKKLGQALTD